MVRGGEGGRFIRAGCLAIHLPYRLPLVCEPSRTPPSTCRGQLWLDAAAVRSVRDKQLSLFGAGITQVAGDFGAQVRGAAWCGAVWAGRQSLLMPATTCPFPAQHWSPGPACARHPRPPPPSTAHTAGDACHLPRLPLPLPIADTAGPAPPPPPPWQDCVSLCDAGGHEIARGLANFSSEELALVLPPTALVSGFAADAGAAPAPGGAGVPSGHGVGRGGGGKGGGCCGSEGMLTLEEVVYG